MNSAHESEETIRDDAATGCGKGAPGWSPPDLPADTSVKRWLDRLLPRTGMPSVLFWAAVIALLLVAPHLSVRLELAVDGLAGLAGSAWCGTNFWRCRHAHCVVTSGGWGALALLAFVAAGLELGGVAGFWQLAFLGVFAVGLAFEGIWYLFHRTNAVMAHPPGHGSIEADGEASPTSCSPRQEGHDDRSTVDRATRT